MKERPFIFTGDRPKLILDEIKTQTRRVIKPQPIVAFYYGSLPQFQCTGFGKKTYSPGYDRHTLLQFCPYGQVGDRLWVREIFWIQHDTEFNEYSSAIIDCGVNLAEDDWAQVWYCATDDEPCNDYIPPSIYSKHPSIFMPRWASRITLEITEVRVERVQDIIQSDNDMRAEGIPLITYDNNRTNWGEMAMQFKSLWDSLNAKRKPTKYDREHGVTEPITPSYAWASNPWVWVISFRRLNG